MVFKYFIGFDRSSTEDIYLRCLNFFVLPSLPFLFFSYYPRYKFWMYVNERQYLLMCNESPNIANNWINFYYEYEIYFREHTYAFFSSSEIFINEFFNLNSAFRNEMYNFVWNLYHIFFSCVKQISIFSCVWLKWNLRYSDF